MRIEWRPEFSCGVQEVDSMHRLIIDRLTTLDAAGVEHPAALPGAMCDLDRAVRMHFEYEEKLLGRLAAQATASHRREHAHLLRLIGDGMSLCDDNRSSEALPTFVRVIGRWLLHEISTNDRHLFAYMRARSGRPVADL
ncbi:hypothetical protein C882_3844 [Caenispirillum salinarum AK4]|uniref:Hemerythrin-like domain-containing protein n=1 Tax=Caenispirillum salinarum AK4 TaxID=1238182 RepID=K9HT40_9PROT|nr:hemerythrin-like metal-binding domain-containing protein [Caenispirillum salinarum]EKV31471.1 hypothetical protein C882_3844 [Caenispirillum salinarum AK4]